MSKRRAVTQSPSKCANEPDVLLQELQGDGMFPNSRLPMLLYRLAVKLGGHDPAAVFEQFLLKPSAKALAWVQGLEADTIFNEGQVSNDRTRQCQAGLRLLLVLRKLEARLESVVPKFSHPDALLDWYIHSGH